MWLNFLKVKKKKMENEKKNCLKGGVNIGQFDSCTFHDS